MQTDRVLTIVNLRTRRRSRSRILSPARLSGCVTVICHPSDVFLARSQFPGCRLCTARSATIAGVLAEWGPKRLAERFASIEIVADHLGIADQHAVAALAATGFPVETTLFSARPLHVAPSASTRQRQSCGSFAHA